MKRTTKRILAVALAVVVILGSGPVRSGAALNTDFDFSVEDIMLLAAAMQLENGCNSDECLYLTGTVIINRVRHPRYPDTIKGVLFQKGQYAKATLDRLYTVEVTDRVLALALRVATHTPIDDEIIFQSMHPELGHVKYHIDTEYFATE